MDSALQKAIDCLTIQDVYLRSSSAALEDAFEPKYNPDLDKLEVQFKHIVTQLNVLEMKKDGDTMHLFRVFVELGARWVLPIENEDGADDPKVMAHIEGIMVAEYHMQPNPGTEALKAFAMQNSSFHIWPYWREYLTSHCLRMNLPKLVLPTRQFARNQSSE